MNFKKLASKVTEVTVKGYDRTRAAVPEAKKRFETTRKELKEAVKDGIKAARS